MGNTNAKEEGENGSDADPSVRSSRSFPENGDDVRRNSVADSMRNTPPGSPGRSRSPLLFAPQVPLPPLQRPAEAPLAFDHAWMDESNESFDPSFDKGIPVLINWSYGGNEVLVEGSWDNWRSRKTLQKSGKDYTILLGLPSGTFHYRFIVDGEWRFIPDLPNVADEMGRTVNLLDVTDYVAENLDGVAEFEAPMSPDSSYSRPFPADEDFAKEPPVVPQQLHVSVLGDEPEEDIVTKPQHVVLNHLFIEKGWAPQSLVALGLTHRFQSKYVTVVLYKPLQKPSKR